MMEEQHYDYQILKNPQKIKNNKIFVSRHAIIFRIFVLSALCFFLIDINLRSIQQGDPYLMYSTLIPIHSILLLMFAWFFFKNPDSKKHKNPLVSIVVPIYNQVNLISFVIKTIYNSSYKNIEVIAVNDGSTDGTNKILDALKKQYPTLNVIHKKNEGKRKTVGAGFFASKGEYVVFIDSDSLMEKKAIEEFVKAFSSDNKIGGVVANAKALNSKKNILTRMQDIWYDYSFNIHKTTESFFGTVLCLSGCMCAYRKEALQGFIQRWLQTNRATGDDRELTTLIQSKSWAKKGLLASYTKNRLDYAAKFDDAEDRILSGQSIQEWKTVYVPSAVVFTEVPEKLRQFYKQQLRWKKGYLRAQFFVSSFFWNKNPLIAFIFYIEYMTTLSLPLILFIVFVYEPFIANNPLMTGYFVLIHTIVGIVEGIDSKFRNPHSKIWYYKPLVNNIMQFITVVALIPAFLTLNTSKWGTR